MFEMLKFGSVHPVLTYCVMKKNFCYCYSCYGYLRMSLTFLVVEVVAVVVTVDSNYHEEKGFDNILAGMPHSEGQGCCRFVEDFVAEPVEDLVAA